MAHNYPKILAPFTRDTNKDSFVNENKWSMPEFQMLNEIDWVWTAKADGTSIGIKWNGERVSFVGHTDKSQIPPKLLKYLQDNFGTDEAESVFEELYGEVPVTIYGEGLSSETNENYGHPDGWFVVFDIYCETSGIWWNREAVKTFAEKFKDSCIEAPVVNISMFMSSYTSYIEDAVDYVKMVKVLQQQGKIGFCPYDSTRPLEGIVGRLPYELVTANGKRLICKVKCKDYKVNDDFHISGFYHPYIDK